MNKTPDMNTDESGAKALVDNMSFLRPFELRSENYTLSPEIKIMDENGKAWSFKNLLETKKAALIYRFSETHCDLCINQHFEN
jgi:replication fork clamp-binding protein CrfC